jgi:hypothetical protein
MLGIIHKHIKNSIFVLLFLFACPAFSQPLTDQDRVRFYDDNSNVRCSGSLVSIGTFQPDVLEKCGEPIRKTYAQGEPFKVWIYRVDNLVYYLGFINGRLERIKSTRCWKDNPDCE